jgi:biotin carboxyl carrier protein
MAKKNIKAKDMDDFEDLRIGDVIYKTKLNKMFKDRKPYKTPDKREIYSFIPGTIVEINIKAGSKVKKGEILMLLEAMKMKNQVLAPFDGVVKKVHVKIGQVVAKNILMIELER